MSGSLFPGSSFWTPPTKTAFKKWIRFKEKKSSGLSLVIFFLGFYLYLLEQCDPPVDWEIGE